MSEETEASPDALSQKMLSSPDQPRLRARHSHTETHAHTHTHTLRPNNIREAQWAVCITRARTPFVNGQGLYLCREDPEGLACQRGSSFLTLPLTRSQSPRSVRVSSCPIHFFPEKSCLVQLNLRRGTRLTWRNDGEHSLAAIYFENNPKNVVTSSEEYFCLNAF